MGFERTLLICCALWVGLAQANPKLYRWVDEHGRVHYGDTLPADAGVRGSAELGKTGQVMKRSESLQERQARQATEAEAARIRKEKDEQNRLDQTLLATYSSEKEIDLALNRAIEFHQMAIQSAEIRLPKVIANQKQVNARALAIAHGKKLPRYLQDQIDANQAELNSLNQTIKTHQEAIIAVKGKYEADKARYRDLTAKK